MALNPEYLETETVRSLNTIFRASEVLPSVRLDEVITQETWEAVRQEIEGFAFTHVTNPLRHVYSWASLPSQLETLFQSQHFLSFLSGILARPVSSITAELYRMTWQHYTVLHEAETTEDTIDLLLDLTPVWDAAWGGSIIYVDGTGEYVSVPPAPNTLTIVERDENIHRFIQYINHYGKQQYRYLVIGTVQ